MGKSTKIRDITYQDMEAVDIPLADGTGTARFIDPSGSTLTSGSQMLKDIVSFDADGVPITGSIESKSSSDLTASGATVTVPAGNYATQATKSVASGRVTAPATISGSAASVSTGTNTLTLTKTVSVTPSVTTSGYVSSGTAGNASVSLTASVTTRAAATLQPGTSAVTIASGTYLTGAQTVPAEPNYVAANIVEGKSLWGLAGAAKLPIISYDTTSHVLSIS